MQSSWRDEGGRQGSQKRACIDERSSDAEASDTHCASTTTNQQGDKASSSIVPLSTQQLVKRSSQDVIDLLSSDHEGTNRNHPAKAANDSDNEEIDDFSDDDDLPLNQWLSATSSSLPSEKNASALPLASQSTVALSASLERSTSSPMKSQSARVSFSPLALARNRPTTAASLPPVVEPAASDSTAVSSKDQCFICGKSLLQLIGHAGRVQHIKRCSQKFGFTGQDVAHVGDDTEGDDEVWPCEDGLAGGGSVDEPADDDKVDWVGTEDNENQSVDHDDDGLDFEWLDHDPRAREDARASYGGSDDSSANRHDVASSTPQDAPSRSKPPTNALALLLNGAKQAAKLEKAKKVAAAAASEQQQSSRGGGGGAGGRWRSSRTYPLPAYKKIPGTSIVVDGFSYAPSPSAKIFFLTHFHSDHYQGLTKTWQQGVIYCSQATANLVQMHLKVASEFLCALPMDKPIPISKSVTVTLLEANHCPGAVLFLFVIGNTRRVLHVGDFRWNREPMMEAIRRISGGAALDDLYLDTTYCNPKYTFPSQRDVIEAAVEVATDYYRRLKHQVLLVFGAYSIGKERLYLAVAEKLRKPLYVDARRYRTLEACGLWDMKKTFTKNPKATNLWVVPLGHINVKRLPSYLKHGYARVVGFRPTGWTYQGKSMSCRTSLIRSINQGPTTVCSVPYSEHSSFNELVDCVMCLQPRKIIPTVSVRKSREQVELLLNHAQKTVLGDFPC